MKPRILSLLFLILTLVSQVCTATSVSSEKDGLVLDVTIATEDGKHLVSCRMTNNSEFPICSASIAYKHAFYAKLTDVHGEELLPNKQWAENFGQKSSRGYQRQKITSAFQVNPGEALNWKFFLEDAYSIPNLNQSKELHVSWETIYGGTKTDRDGNPYHFPPDWKTSVTVPLAEVGIGKSAVKQNEETATSDASRNRRNKESVETIPSMGRSHVLWAVSLGILIGLLAVVALKRKSKGIIGSP